MFQAILLTLGLEIVVLGIAAIITFCIIRIFVSLSIVFSRITFSLLFALGLDSYYEFTDGKANIFIWAAIILMVIMLLSILPRVNGALKFFCTAIISILIIGVVTLGVGSFVGSIFGKEFLITKGMEIAINILGVLMAVGALAEENEMVDFEKFSNTAVIGVEKVIAALVYGAAIAFACMSNYGNWDFPGKMQLLIMMAGTGIAFLADRFLIEVHS